MKIKRKITACLLALLFGAALVSANVAQEVTQRYGVDGNSNYQQLVGALQQAATDFRGNPKDALAMAAMHAIYGWIPQNKRIKANYDYFIQQAETEVYLSGIIGCNAELEAGATTDATTKQALADSIWHKLGILQPTSDIDRELANSAVTTLLLLSDDRGLEAVLTNRRYIENIQAEDGWDKDSPQAKFTDLVTHYTALIGHEAGARERVALYELARIRKAGGATEIVSTNSVIDLSQF